MKNRKKSVRLSDIAKELNTSVVTVSNALNGRKGVSEELSKRILKKALEMGYEIEKLEDREEVCNKIGVLVPEVYAMKSPSFYMDIYQKIVMEITKKRGFVSLELLSRDKEERLELPELAKDSSIEGMIVLGEVSESYAKMLRHTVKIPVIFVDTLNDLEDTDFILTDGFRGTYGLTKKLIQMGHKDLVFLGTPLATNSITDRFLGFRMALIDGGIEYNETMLHHDRPLNDQTIAFDLPEKLPAAFVCNCDATANRLVLKLQEKNINVPEDVSVVGFDGFDTITLNGIVLTTYDVNRDAIARISVNTLIKRIAGDELNRGIRMIEGHIVSGNSVRKV